MRGEAGYCNGTVIIHSGRLVTCTDPICQAASHGMAAVLDRHCWFVSCRDTLGSECPICRFTLDRPRFEWCVDIGYGDDVRP